MSTSAFVQAFTQPPVAPTVPEGMTFTENGALTYNGTGNALVDFYSKVMARNKNSAMSDENIQQFMEAAWNEDKLLTLKLVANLRDIRGNSGKGERHAATVCWQWLIKHHPKQVIANMMHIPFFGRWKDLLDICLDTDLQTETLNLFANQLLTDRQWYLEGFQKEDPVERSQCYGKISLASKWAPTEGCSYDKAAKKKGLMRPSHQLAQLLCVNAGTSFSNSRSMMSWYRKTYLAPLRETIGIVETYLCQKRFDEIDFNKVPGVAMKMYTRKTFNNSEKWPKLAERFAQWQKDVLNGVNGAKINSGTIDPYELVERFYNNSASDSEKPTLEAFYKDMVQKLRNKLAERFGNEDQIPSTAFVVDVSGSMHGTPMTVAISLGIFGSKITNPAWRDMFITFHNHPSIVSISHCKSLEECVKVTAAAPWGGSTDLMATFDLILSRAQECNLTSEQMPKRMVIISDMQFNQACGVNIFTNLETMRAKFRSAGYQMPVIVFWNVRGNTDPLTGAPATATESGVIMISGFSKSLLNVIMEGDEITVPTPMDIMLEALSDERYNRLTVV